MTDAPSISRPVDLDDRSIDQLRSLYEASFPSSERIALDVLVDGVAGGRRWLFVASVNNTIVGFVFILFLHPLHVCLGEYLAVAPKYRHGLGRALVAATLSRVRSDTEVLGILCEVETPDYSGAWRRQEQRIAYYQRFGFRVVEAAPCYTAPDLSGAAVDGVSMQLMWLPTNTSLPMNGALLRRSVQAIYLESYGLTASSSFVNTNLARLQ